jgi:catechol 2,3-dioxygenase-like lactoylglutathione lyase family enzyme
MPLSHIEHILVLVDDLEKTRDWYRDVLGMEEGPHPDFGFPVYWMYLGGVDVVHIGQSARTASDSQRQYLGRLAQASDAGTGALDHIAFRATGLPRMIEHLRAKNITFTQRRANGQALYRLFFLDPNGIKIELNFAAEEAVNIVPELMASDLMKTT